MLMHDETLKYPHLPPETIPPTLPYPTLPLKKEKEKGRFVRAGSVATRP